MRGSPITACVNYENAYRDLLLASQSVAHVSASLPAPGDETLFQRSHAQVETPCDNTDKHDAHDNHVRAQKARSIEHHLPEARPHSALQWETPAEFARRARQRAPTDETPKPEISTSDRY